MPAPGERPDLDPDEEIIELLEHTTVALGMTEDGNVGVWLGGFPDWNALPFAVGNTASEALLIAAELYRRATPGAPPKGEPKNE